MLASPREPKEADSFSATRWTLVLAAGAEEGTPSQSLDALAELCRIYWRPLYLFLRREGHSPADAQDLTQGFFADLIENRSYSRANREKGRFRSFLLGAMKHFVADEHDRMNALKRGGGKQFQPLDEKALAEIESQFPSVSSGSADAIYEREWAAALLRQAMDRVAQESAIKGKSALFQALRSHLPSGDDAIPYEEIARQLNRGVVTLRSDVARLRSRFRVILREEVRGTLSDPADVANELRYLCQVLAQA